MKNPQNFPVSATNTGSIQALDVAYLNEQTFGDEELARELLRLFTDQAVQLLHQVREAMQGEACREAIHKLNGSARAIGAWRLAECASDIEFELINNNLDISFLHERSLMTTLENELGRVQGAILLYVREGKSSTPSGSTH
jgi:HPt (histidine-containing phosphotransfer) domain-containing protein